MNKTIFSFILISFSFVAIAFPEQCIELPERKSSCTHKLYKRSPVDIENTEYKQGDMVCVCMEDFLSIRIEELGPIAKRQQMQYADSAAQKIDMSAETLIQLVRN